MQCTRYLYSSFKDPTFYNSLLFRDQTGYVSKKKIGLVTLGAVLESLSCITALFGCSYYPFSNANESPAWTWVISIEAAIVSKMIFNRLNENLCNKELDDIEAEKERCFNVIYRGHCYPLLKEDYHVKVANLHMNKLTAQTSLLFNKINVKDIVAIIQEYSEDVSLSTIYFDVLNTTCVSKNDYLKTYDKSINPRKEALLIKCLEHPICTPSERRLIQYFLQLYKEHQK